MEKGLARFRVSLLCFCCGCFVAAALLQLLCCSGFVAALLRLLCCAEVADSRRRSFPLRGSLPFSGANAACGCLPPRRRGHSNRVQVQCQSGANAACGCLPPQRCRNSNRVLVHFPFREPMPPAAVCHLSAAGTPTASWFSAFSGDNAACNCLPPQRCRHSNRVLAQGPCPQVLQRHPGVAKGGF